MGLLQEAAEEGDVRAVYARASCYVDGKYGSIQDSRKAFYLFKIIEDFNVAEAVFAIAYSYDLGDGCRRNRKVAFSYYVKSGLLGHLEACRQVSEFYREGIHVPFNARIGRAWGLRARCKEEEISPPYRLWLR